jgi:hypothetical protein
MKEILVVLLIAALVFVSGCVQEQSPAGNDQNNNQNGEEEPPIIIDDLENYNLTSNDWKYINATIDVICSSSGTESEQEAVAAKYGYSVQELLDFLQNYNPNELVSGRINNGIMKQCPEVVS